MAMFPWIKKCSLYEYQDITTSDSSTPIHKIYKETYYINSEGQKVVIKEEQEGFKTGD